ncbi:Protein of unknown function [Geodermatophilus pulveris]|uniref:Pvc16 N-terminal domain-containing protein n=1 Tax=Geodermatophilus pulveris TaxID=1564159 RepID=A0A239C2I3_9ACTN|nr:DUF4255 domain-containing protein [Geodermatophilus pulveris]SNS14376.1 Protein of unknown function [Geodermatophilus pulveris]
MANHLAIATVTAALRLRLTRDISPVVPDVQVVARRPDAADDKATSQVTVFLYRVLPNGALRNSDLPTRGTDGVARRRPRIALDLHYLLSFSGDEGGFVPQRMLGSSMASLHSEPGLSRAELATATEGDPSLAGSDIDSELESVVFTLGDLSLDDMSKVWSVFFQTPYRLSVGYEASVVLIEADIPTSEPLPVRQEAVDALPVRQPVIHLVRVAAADQAPDDGPYLEILGRDLRAAVTTVRFDDDEPRGATTATATRVLVPLGDVPAGVHRVQVVHEVPIGDPPVPHRVVESAAVPFVLRPVVDPRFVAGGGVPPDPPGNAVDVGFTPPLAAGQRVRLLLNERTDPAPTDRPLRFHRLEPAAEPAAGATTSRFPADAVEPGTYLVRAQVDGAESLLDLQGGEGPPGPRVTVP